MRTRWKQTLVHFVAALFAVRNSTSIPIMHQHINSEVQISPEFDFLTPPKLESVGEINQINSQSTSAGSITRIEDDFNRHYHDNARYRPPRAQQYPLPEKTSPTATARRTNKASTPNHIDQQFRLPVSVTPRQTNTPIIQINGKERVQPPRDNNKPHRQNYNPDLAGRSSENHDHICRGGDHVCISGVCRPLPRPQPYFEPAQSKETRNLNSETRHRSTATNEVKASSNYFEVPIIGQSSNPGPNNALPNRDSRHFQKPVSISLGQEVPSEGQPKKVVQSNSQHRNVFQRGHQPFNREPDSAFIVKRSLPSECRKTDTENTKPFIQSGSSAITGLLLIEMDISEASDTYETKLETDEDNSILPRN